MRRPTLFLILILALSVTPILHAQCTAANTQTFTSSLLGPVNNGFGNAMLTFNQNGSGTLTSSTLGLGNINGITLFQGDPMNGGQPLETFTTSTARFQDGRFNNAVFIDPTIASLIAQNPQNFFFAITTPDFPQGAVTGRL